MATSSSWVKHPGFYIREEMEARGWLQRDLAFILGCPEQAISVILAEKRGITPDMAKALGEAFDIHPETFANLQKAYDMAQARNPYEGVAERRDMQSTYPIREMISRGWLVTADASSLEDQLKRFFIVESSDDVPYLRHAAKKSKYEERNIAPAQLAWLFRVKQLAMATASLKYSEQKLRDALPRLEELLRSPEEARHVPRILAECGVRFVVVEKLTKADIDGVCFWLDKDSPVIGMSMQRDKIDNFWFVLRHEIEHVLQKHGQTEEMIDPDLQGESAGISNLIPMEERVANAAAANFCAPREKFDTFMRRKQNHPYEKDVVAFALVHGRHPGIIVGQIQRRTNNYGFLHRYISKIRRFVIPGAVVDGWGQVLPISSQGEQS